jgi:Ca2+-binding EF-hand superfamily protein
MIEMKDEDLKSILKNRVAGGINYFVERELSKLMDLMLERIKQLGIRLTYIKSSIGFDVEKVLKNIDYSGLGFLDIPSLIKYMMKYKKYNLKENDAQILLNKLDVDKDGIVSYQDIRCAFFIKKNSQQISLSNHLILQYENNDSKYQITSRLVERKNLSFDNLNDHIKILKKYFNSIIDFEKTIERQRIQLTQQEDINLQSFISLFTDKEYITFNEFMNFLKTNHAYVSEYEISLLFSRFNNNKDNKLNILELTNILLSRNNGYANLLKERLNTYINISDKSISLIIELFRLLINNENEN